MLPADAVNATSRDRRTARKVRVKPRGDGQPVTIWELLEKVWKGDTCWLSEVELHLSQVWTPGVGSGWGFGTVSPAALNVGDCGILSHNVPLGTGRKPNFSFTLVGAYHFHAPHGHRKLTTLAFRPHPRPRHPHRASLPSPRQPLPGLPSPPLGAFHTLSSLNPQPPCPHCLAQPIMKSFVTMVT